MDKFGMLIGVLMLIIYLLVQKFDFSSTYDFIQSCFDLLFSKTGFKIIVITVVSFVLYVLITKASFVSIDSNIYLYFLIVLIELFIVTIYLLDKHFNADDTSNNLILHFYGFFIQITMIYNYMSPLFVIGISCILTIYKIILSCIKAVLKTNSIEAIKFKKTLEELRSSFIEIIKPSRLKYFRWLYNFLLIMIVFDLNIITINLMIENNEIVNTIKVGAINVVIFYFIKNILKVAFKK